MWALTSLSTGPLVHNKRTTSDHTTCTIHRQLTYCSPCFRYRHINWPQCNIPNPVLVLHFSHPSRAFHSKIGSMTTHACNWCLSGQDWPRVPTYLPWVTGSRPSTQHYPSGNLLWKSVSVLAPSTSCSSVRSPLALESKRLNISSWQSFLKWAIPKTMGFNT